MPIPEIVPTTTENANTDTGNVIHIWMFNPNIVYSSSAAPAGNTSGTPAIKLLYRLITQEEADKMLEAVTCDSQEINLPLAALGEVIRLLDESNLLLPEPERVFKEWKVALLPK